MRESVNVRVGILEDEAKYIEEYRNFLAEWKNDRRTFTLDAFTDGNDLLNSIQNRKYDILFLDIVLPSESGIVIANDLRKAGYENLIVFITRYTDYWPKAFDVGAFRYYLKPIKQSDFLFCMKQAVRKILGRYFKFSVDQEYRQMLFDNIVYFSVLGHYTTIHAVNEDIKIKASISDIRQNLPDNFIQCHRSFIVNLDHVASLHGNRLNLDNGNAVFISQAYLKNVRSEFARQIR